MKRKRLEQLLQFDDLHVCVIGDVMLDQYLIGKIDRISPEAPVPIINLTERSHKLGGAANVAMNTASLGSHTTLIGIIGDDKDGQIIQDIASVQSNLNTELIVEKSRKTSCKTRVLSQDQHILRIDNEDINDCSKTTVSQVTNILDACHKGRKIDTIIFQDYNKGFFSRHMISTLMSWCAKNNVKTCLDPKFENIEDFKNVNLFKPNLKELVHLLGKKVETDLESLKEIGSRILNQLNCEIFILTLGAEGIFVCNANNYHLEGVQKRSIVDVSGAGDTVIAIMSLLFCAQMASLEEMSKIANYAAAAVCSVPGVGIIEKAHILSNFKK